MDTRGHPAQEIIAGARNASGFSMVEVMVVVSMVAILAAAAFPSYITLIDGEKVSSLAEEFSQSLSLARSAAIKSGTPVVVCATSNGTSCSNQWSNGWLAFIDANRNSALDAEDTIVSNTANDSNAPEMLVMDSAGDALSTVRFNYRGAPNVIFAANVSKGDAASLVTVSAFGKSRAHDKK